MLAHTARQARLKLDTLAVATSTACRTMVNRYGITCLMRSSPRGWHEPADHSLLRCDYADMTLVLRVGERFEMKGRTLTVSRMQADVGPQVRDYLIKVARRGGTVTYGSLKEDLSLTYPPNGLGRVLDVISEDCHRRGEPSLAPLVVNKATGEAGSDYDGHPESDRRALYGYWS